MKKSIQKRRFMLPAIVAGLIVSSLVFAGAKNSGERMERLAEKLSLDDTQKTEFVAIMEEQHAKKKVIKDEIRALKEVRFQEHHEDTKAALSQILDTEQLAKLDEIRQERMEKRKEHKRGDRKH